MEEQIGVCDLKITLTEQALRRLTTKTLKSYTPREVCHTLRSIMLSRLGVEDGWYTNSDRTKWLMEEGYGHYEREVFCANVTPEQREVLECLSTLQNLLSRGHSNV